MNPFIPFNKPSICGNELDYIKEAVSNGKISSDGEFTRKCENYFESKLKFKKVILTNSCTSALEMAAILLEIQADDEIIVPSFTFVSTANAFVLRGAKIVFADSNKNEPCIDVSIVEALITKKTKAIVVVHYAGIACDMDLIMELANRKKLIVIEDAAQAITSSYNGRSLGSIGHLATFSFHETKNINCGEGGMLVINDERYIARAEIISDKGTNRRAFNKGEVLQYNWLDIGSSYLLSELAAAYLFGQLECLSKIQINRQNSWNRYYMNLNKMESEKARLPFVPEYATNNNHIFYLILNSEETRNELINHLRMLNVHAVHHYLPLHVSPYYHTKHDGRLLENSIRYSKGIIRLPLYYGIGDETIDNISEAVVKFIQ